MSLSPELLKDKKILIVEDDKAISELVMTHFSRMGCEVFQAYDGATGLELYREHHPEVLILDLNLPEMDGNSIIHEIRKLDQDTAIIVTTAYADLGDNLYAVDALLIKPISQKQISEALEEILLQKEKKQKEEQVSTHNILLFTTNPLMMNKIRSALKENERHIFHTENPEEALEILGKKQIHFIYVQMSHAQEVELKLIEEIKNDPLTKWIPLCVVSSYDDVELRQELFRLGINDYLVEPFFSSELSNRFTLMIEREGSAKNSLTIRVINATVKLFRCEELAFRMESVARIVCRKLGVETRESVDVSRAAKYLSIAVEKVGASEAIEYLRGLYIGRSVLRILSQQEQCDKSGKIAWAILNYERVLAGRPENSVYGCPGTELRSLVESIYSTKEMLIQSMVDIDYAQWHLERHLKDKIANTATQAFLCKSLKKLLYHSVTYHHGASFEIEEDRDSFVLIVKPEDRNVMKRCLNLMQFASEFPSGVSFEYHLTNRATQPQYRLGWQQEVSKKEEPESETIQTTASLETREETIPAERYVREHPLSDEEQEYFNALEDEMLDVLEGARYKADVQHSVVLLSDLIYKYANAIIYFNEFTNVSEALFGLGHVIRSSPSETIEEKKARQMIVVLDSIISNLVRWRQSIFIDQSVQDIHYLDDSIMADCDQFMVMLHPQASSHGEESEDDNDLELF